MFKNEHNSRTTNKNIQIQIILELFHDESNMLGTWVKEPNVVEHSHTFLGITTEEIHT